MKKKFKDKINLVSAIVVAITIFRTPGGGLSKI